jgi:hypothetical protein
VFDDLIYAADFRSTRRGNGKIVILNVDGECQDVIWPGFRIRNMTIRTVDASTYLFAAGPGNIYSANLSGANGMPSAGAGACSNAGTRNLITSALGIAVDGQGGTPSFLYAAVDGHIYRYPLVATGDRFCPGEWDIKHDHDGSVTSTNRHPPARMIELDPEDDNIIYITSNSHEVAKYEMAATNNGLTEVWRQGSRGRGISADDGTNVLFWSSRALFIGKGDDALVYVGSNKPSVQTFDKDHASGQWKNELGGSMGSRMDGAKAAISAKIGSRS